VALADFALVVGIDSYPGLRPLKGAEADARDFYDWVTDPAGGNVDAQNAKRIVTTDFAPLADSADGAKPVRDHIEDFFKMVNKAAARNAQAQQGIAAGRRIYLFFSGHGFSPSLDRSGVLMANATDDMPFNIGAQMWADRLYDGGWFEEVLLFQDACRQHFPSADVTPPFFQSRNPPQDPPRKRFYAFSAKSGLLAVERPLANGHTRGVFTSTLLEGLRLGAVDAPSGDVTTNQLKVYLESNMQKKLTDVELEDADISKVPEVSHADPFVIVAGRPGAPRTNATFPVELRSAAPGKILNNDFEVVAENFTGPPPWTAKLQRGLYQYVLPGGGTTLFKVTGALDASQQPVVTIVSV